MRTFTAPSFLEPNESVSAGEYQTSTEEKKTEIDNWLSNNAVKLDTVAKITLTGDSVTLETYPSRGRCVSLCDFRDGDDTHPSDQHVETRARTYPVE